MASAKENEVVNPMTSAIFAYIDFTRYRIKIVNVGNKDDKAAAMASLTVARLDSPYDRKPVLGKGKFDCYVIFRFNVARFSKHGMGMINTFLR